MAICKRVRIVLVTPAAHPDVMGGLPWHVHQLAHGMGRLGHHVTVHAPRYPDLDVAAADQFEMRSAYTIVRHPFRRMPWDRLGTRGNPLCRSMQADIAASGADLVHVHGALFFTGWFAMRGARQSGAPLMTTIHGVRAERGLLVNGLQSAWMHTMGRAILQASQRVLVLNKIDGAAIGRYGAEQAALRQMHNFVDPSITPGPRDKSLVLWHGRHVPEKGIDVLLHAWRRVEGAVDAELWLVGDGPTRAASEQLARRLGLHNVRFKDSLPADEVPDLLAQGSTFVLPSRREGAPLALLEAMAAGLDVITTAAFDVAPDAVHVQPDDVKGLAARIVESLQDQAAARKRGDRLRTVAMRDASLTAFLEKHEALYTQLLDAKRQARP